MERRGPQEVTVFHSPRVGGRDQLTKQRAEFLARAHAGDAEREILASRWNLDRERQVAAAQPFVPDEPGRVAEALYRQLNQQPVLDLADGVVTVGKERPGELDVRVPLIGRDRGEITDHRRGRCISGVS